MRLIWLIGGLLAVAVGAVGAVLPLLPTVPLLLLAGFCFANSSERMHYWLLNHRVFGPQIVAWQSSGAISPRAKRLATISILVAFAVAVAIGAGLAILAIQALVLTGVLVFIWTRPAA
ncbi:MAG: YbaN family protein [Halocynthiibacter sp.]